MSYFLDISLLLIIVITIIVGWHKGLIRSVLGVTKSLFAILVSYFFGPTVSAWVSEKILTGRVTEYVHSRLLAMFEVGADTFDLTTILENLPSWLSVFFEKTGVDPAALAGDLANLTAADALTLEQLASSMAAPITKMLSDLIAYTAVFLIAMLIFAIVAFLLEKVADLPIIRGVDRTLGLVLGVFCALIYASVYTLLMFAIMSMVEGYYENVAFHAAYEQSWLFKLFYNINIFRFIFGIG
jgi:uncharacterized membrane protein required for colicin V production